MKMKRQRKTLMTAEVGTEVARIVRRVALDKRVPIYVVLGEIVQNWLDYNGGTADEKANRELIGEWIEARRLGMHPASVGALAERMVRKATEVKPNRNIPSQRLITFNEWDQLSPWSQGYALYMQEDLPSSELKVLKCPYPKGSKKAERFHNGQQAAVLEAQDSEE